MFVRPGSVRTTLAAPLAMSVAVLTAIPPQGLLVQQLIRKPLTAEHLRMHTNDKDLFLIGAIENADSPTFRQTEARAPKKIMLQFFGTRLLETVNFATLLS
jgi:hypothetical protein